MNESLPVNLYERAVRDAGFAARLRLTLMGKRASRRVNDVGHSQRGIAMYAALAQRGLRLVVAAWLAAMIVAQPVRAQGVQSQIGTPVVAVAGDNAFHLFSGDMFCGLVASGGVKCFGNIVSSVEALPVDIAGFVDAATVSTPERVWTAVDLASGRSRSVCALVAYKGATTAESMSQARCWGPANSGIFLGNADARPLAFAGDHVVNLSVGAHLHGCVVTQSATVRCGGNAGLWLGTTATDGSGDIVLGDVGNPKLRALSVAAGVLHTCALTLAGDVYCWGRNNNNQLGVEGVADTATPTKVPLPSGVAASALRAGQHNTCAITWTGELYCWGKFELRSDLWRVPAINGATALSLNNVVGCALTASGGIKCWGGAPGSCGINWCGSWHPTADDISGVTANMHGFAGEPRGVGGGFTHMVQRNGSALVWLGDRWNTPQPYPFFNSKVSAVTGNSVGACAMISPGTVRCWGNGPLGNGSASIGAAQTPVTVTGLETGAQWLANSRFQTCAVNATHQVVCWNSATAPAVAGGVDGSNVSGNDLRAKTVAVADNFRCALMQSGVVKCWGDNTVGQLGIDTSGAATTTVGAAVDFGVGVTASAAVGGGAFSNSVCAIVTGGGVKCWGSNSGGQLGNTTVTVGGFSATPVEVSGLAAGVKSVAVGSQFACAINASNGVLCWGKNDVGQVGDGSNIDRTTPVAVAGLTSGVTAIAAGVGSACALLSDGRVKCWGRNDAGQLGNGSTTPSNVPVDVIGVSGATLIALSGQNPPFACAETTAEGLRCWGRNLGGQLGDATTTNRSTAVTVWPGQSIDFTPPPHLRRGVATPLAAVSTSGLPVSFDSYTPSACTVSGDTTTGFSVLVGASATDVALCGIRATQAGGVGAQFAAAPPRLALLQVTDADCGSANGVTVNSPPSTNLCAIGTASAVLPAASSYRWSCNTATSLGGATCNAPFARLNIDASDASSQYLAAGDGAMLLRYLFGMRGDALTAGIFGSNSQRTSAQVETHIADNLLLFDVDGDGQTLPLTDGLMILRRMLGTGGSALTDGLKRTALTDEGVASMIDRLKP